MFNVLLEWDDPLNRTTVQPEPYPRLDVGPSPNIIVAHRFPKAIITRVM
jgi:hypothetical protein